MVKSNLSGFTVAAQEPEKSTESYPAYIGRQILGGLEKIPESVLNLHETLKNVGNQVTQSFGPNRPPALSEQLPIPTSEQFRSGSEKALGYKPGAFTPKGIGENIAQEAIRLGGTLGLGEATSALSGGQGSLGALKTGAESIKSAAKPILGSAIGGQAGKMVAEFFNLPEPIVGTFDLVGSFLGGAYGTRGKVAKSVAKNYEQAESHLSPQAFYESRNAQKIADNLQTKISKLPGFEKAKDPVEKFTKLVGNQGRVNIKDALDFKIALNSEWNNYPKKIRDQIITPMLNSLKNDVINPYGETNKAFFKPWSTAEKDFSVLKKGFIKTEKIAHQAEKLIEKFPDKLSQSGLKALQYIATGAGGYGAFQAIQHPFISFGAIGGIAGLNELNKFGGLLQNSETARKLMKEVAKQLSLGNSNKVLKLLNKLDSEIPEENNFKDFVLA